MRAGGITEAIHRSSYYLVSEQVASDWKLETKGRVPTGYFGYIMWIKLALILIRVLTAIIEGFGPRLERSVIVGITG
jgi:hypothetical protein